MDSQDIKPRVPQDEKIIENKELNIWEALTPVFVLVIMLFYNVFFVFGDDALSGSNQFILILGAAVAAIVGFYNKVTYKQMLDEVAENIKSTSGAILILLMVGALAGTWLISGIIPSMIYYGLQLLNPTIFLAASVVICAIISIATGSSWTTSATVGIALIGIGETLGISLGMTAGAVLSGAYFGDKMSPLSDTTNLAPAMAGGELFTHIKYMSLTTIPTIVITLIVFIIIGLNIDTTGSPNISDKLFAIDHAFTISPWLFLVPVAVILMIIKKTPPLIALLIGTLLGGVAAIIAQPNIVMAIAETDSLTFQSAYKGAMRAITVDSSVETSSQELNSQVPDFYLHRGFMHSILFSVIAAVLLGWLVYILYNSGKRLNTTTRRDWIILFFVSLFTHPILDCFTPYGTQLFAPFSNYRVAFNNIAVVDPFYTLPFLICMIVLMFFNRRSKKRQLWLKLGLGISSIYMIFTLGNKLYIDSIFRKSSEESHIHYSSFSTQPAIFNNLLWYGIAETESAYYVADYSLSSSL